MLKPSTPLYLNWPAHVTMAVPGSITLLALLAGVLVAQTPPTDILRDITFTINEQLEAGIYIGNIAAESKIGTDGGYSFKLVNAPDALLTVNLTTGELRTAKVIDREVECRNEVTCLKEYGITAFKDSIVLTIQVHLKILDINDETPVFDPNSMSLSLSELTPVNTSKPLRSAVDLDKGANNGVASYSFSSFLPPADVAHFQLVSNMSTNTVSLKLVKALDHETKDHYTLHVLAKDAGNPIRTGTLTVDIEVIDENDNKPLFEHATLNVSVTEDISVGKSIITLRATDKDSGKYGQVQYALSEPTTYINDHFSVDPVSGELRVKQRLNFEAGNSEKTIYIVASDQGETAQSSTATVYLTIQDAGNNPPHISPTILSEELSPNTLLVSELANIDKAIMYIGVTDSDSGDNGNVSCSIINTFFGIKRNSQNDNNVGYTVFVQRELDRETQPQHNLSVSCSDLGGLSSSVDFKVVVKDENDHTPVFDTYLYHASIKENNTYGAEILRLKATDQDAGENARISYQVNNTKDFEVVIENDVAVVRALTILDREKYSQKVFQVLAVDHGKIARTGTATVQLDIIDINDMKPEFSQARYVFHVAERQESNTHVDYVTAVDEDQDDAQRLRYEMVPAFSDNGTSPVPFIVLDNGEIKTTMELDRETRDTYVFKVRAVDHGVPPLSSTVDVVVMVDDVNDNVPVFVFPTSSNNSVTAFNEVSDKEIARLVGVDQDAGINQELIYFIVEGNPDGVFFLDANSGKLSIIKYVHIEAQKKFNLLVSIYDKGKPQLSTKETLTVTLLSTNATNVGGLGDGEDNKNNVIIVVTVVCITSLLSVTIITVICLIRRKDTLKCGSKGQLGGNLRLPSLASKMGSKKPLAPQPLTADNGFAVDGGQRGRKEVSFSLEDGDSLSSNDFRMLTTKEKVCQSNYLCCYYF